MRKFLFGVLCMFVFKSLFAQPVEDQLKPSGIFKQQQIEIIHKYVKKYPEKTELSIAYIKNNKVDYFGVQRVGSSLVNVNNNNAVFEAGSISKVFTSAILAKLVTEGRLSLDDPIEQYLPFKLNAGNDITFKQLSNHTSGMPRLPGDIYLDAMFKSSDNPYKNYNQRKLVNYLSNKLTLKSKPGKKYRYSNLGAGVLAYVLGVITEKTYEENLQRYFFKPLKMQNTTTVREKIEDLLVIGLSKKGEPASNWDMAAFEGAGAVLTTTEDLAKFATAQLEQINSSFKLQQESTFSVSRWMEIALGWHIMQKEDKSQLTHWHNGGTGGYTSMMALDIGHGTGVIILSNISAFHIKSGKIDKLAIELLDGTGF